MKLSARNVFQGKVVSVKTGPIMASVKVDIGGGNVVTALISSDAANDLALAEGDQASVIMKATEVMIAK
jgi:molybdopterin-binding protein